MFDAGILEMVVVGVIALIVLGPERLPKVAAKVGRFVAKARAFIANTRSDIERELQAEELRSLLSKQEQEIRELRNIMQTKTDHLQSEFREVNQALYKAQQDVVAATKANPSILPASDQKDKQ